MKNAFENEPPEVEDTSEFREPKAEKIVGLLDKLELSEVLSTEEKRQQFFRGLDFETFRDFLVRINGISRGIPINKREIDGRDVVLDAGAFGVRATPDFEDKETLLRELYQLAQEMDDPKSSALLLGAGINAVHPFTDGNGRTARLVFTLLHDGYNGSLEEHQKLVGLLGESGRKKLDLTPAHIQREITERQKENAMLGYMNNPTIVGYESVRELQFSENIPAEKKERFIRMIEDGYQDYALMAIYEYLLGHGKFDQKYFQTVPDDSHHITDEQGKIIPDPEHTTKQIIPIKNIIEELNEADVDEILGYNSKAKRDYVRLLANVIAHPENYPFPDKSGWNEYTNLKEYYLNRLMSRHKEFFKR